MEIPLEKLESISVAILPSFHSIGKPGVHKNT